MQLKFNGRILNIPKEKIIAAYGGALKAKENILSDITKSNVKIDAIPVCMTAANQGSTTAISTLEVLNMQLSRLIQRRLER